MTSQENTTIRNHIFQSFRDRASASGMSTSPGTLLLQNFIQQIPHELRLFYHQVVQELVHEGIFIYQEAQGPGIGTIGKAAGYAITPYGISHL